ncbi:MAG TPA: hypothetical protein VNN17_03785, partial [Terriglobia bacterium]|nr:hypothetical protein [Terriglobia bacterium]
MPARLETIGCGLEAARRQAEALLRGTGESSAEQEAAARAAVAKQCNYLGDYDTAALVLAPYLLDSPGDNVLNEQALSHVESRNLRGDLLVEIALLMNHFRKYALAVDLLLRAIDLYEGSNAHFRKANAYHWLAFTKLNQHDFAESERCDLKAMELLYQRANQDKRHVGS